jgi:hypothetical protein
MHYNIIKPGIHSGLPLTDYLRAVQPGGEPYLSGGTLLAGRPPRTPAHMKAIIDGDVQETSSGFALGSLCHAALDVSNPSDVFAPCPDVNFATKKGKAEMAEWMRYHNAAPPLRSGDLSRRKNDWLKGFEDQTGLTPVSQSDWDKVQAMCASIGRDERARKLFEFTDGEREISFLRGWAHEGLDDYAPTRARPDYYSLAGKIIVEVKTTARTADRDGFGLEIWKRGYHIKAYLYRAIVAELTDTMPHDWDFWFLVIESYPPYIAKAWRLDAPAMARGREEFTALMHTYLQCRKSGVWPGYPEDTYEITVPPKRGDLSTLSEW